MDDSSDNDYYVWVCRTGAWELQDWETLQRKKWKSHKYAWKKTLMRKVGNQVCYNSNGEKSTQCKVWRPSQDHCKS